MSKLLSANFSRLRKDKIFWLCMGGMLIYAIIYMMSSCKGASGDVSGITHTLEKYYFNFALSIGAFCAVFTSVFLGTEYSDGTMRNKLIVGHTRAKIYIANLLVSFVATLSIMFMWLIGAMVGIPTLGLFEMSMTDFSIYLLIVILLVAVFSAIFTLIAMLSSNKTTTALISILLFFGLLLCSSIIYNSLNEPETISTTGIVINGVNSSELIANPNYIGGTIRSLVQTLLYILPTGQAIQVSFLKVEQPFVMALSSIFITAIVTICGIMLFRKKDLK